MSTVRVRVFAVALLAVLVQGVYAAQWVERAAFAASSFAGETTSAVVPVPNATNAQSQYDSFFPDATEVGFAGPTPTGDEAELVATATSLPKVHDANPLVNPSTYGNKSTFDVLHSFGNLSPMFSVKSFGLPENASALIPEGCDLTQVHLLHRHGARYPTSGSLPAAFAAKVHDTVLNGTGFTATGDLAFLNTWSYKLGAEILTPFGRQQLYDLGVSFRVKYGELLKNFTGLPVFRTTSEERMVQSAENFGAGFFGIPDYLTAYRQLIIVESSSVALNNTLAVNCANQGKAGIGDLGNTYSSKWAEVYLAKATKRLQGMVKGLNLTVTDVLSMQEACAYETVALGTSAFCDLFTVEEWKGFNYFLDLDFWYGAGPGNPTSAAVGIGYVQELVSRLTQTPIAVHNSSTNATITDNSVTFPLDQPIFVDASHDTDISAIIVAMNFTSLNANGPMPTDHIPAGQTYFSNKIVPFGTQLVGQVMSCPSLSSPTQVRWLLNDAPLPLTGISGCPANALGLCPLDTFVSAMKNRIEEVDFAFDCEGNYTVPSPDLIVDGRPLVGERPTS